MADLFCGEYPPFGGYFKVFDKDKKKVPVLGSLV